MTQLSFTLMLLSSIWLLVGCGESRNDVGHDSPIPARAKKVSGWLGIPSVVEQVVELVHDGTGWLLDKHEVSVTKIGDIRQMEEIAGKFLADYQIAVARSGTRFETIAKDVPCDEQGIPTEDSVTRIREAVEDIKTKIKRFQE